MVVKTDSRSQKILFWLVIALTLFGAAITIVFGILAFVNPGYISPDGTMNPAASFFAHHFAGRNFVIALMMLLPLALREKRLLVFALFLRGLTEGYDGVLEIIETKTAIPGAIFLVYAALFIASAVYLLNMRGDLLRGAIGESEDKEAVAQTS